MEENELKLYNIRDLDGYDFGYWIGKNSEEAKKVFYNSGADARKHPEVEVKEVIVPGFDIILKPKKLEERVKG